MGKIKLSHNEVDVKLFLEVVGVYVILALILAGAYYIEPAITGFATVEKNVNYTDIVNFAADEDDVFVWNLGNPGKLKSVKIDGLLVGNGSAKVYIEHENERYLMLDSSKLVEKPSGLFGITGLAVSDEDKGKDKDDKKSPDGDEKESNELDEGKDESEEEDNEDESDKESDDEQEGDEAGEDEDGKEDDEVPINETTITNETQPENKTVDETIEKIIDIKLEYGNNEIYDANNDGIETLSGIIDFHAADTGFNWIADTSRLCTRYEIFSAESGDSNFACHGSNDCCSLVGLESSRDLWDESLYLGYGDFGSAESNIVFAQVLYANYSLNPDNPYSDVAYSEWKNLSAEFIEGIEFENVCAESCAFDGDASSYNLIIEVEDAELRISRVDYIIEENAANNAPKLEKEIGDVTITKNDEHILALNEHFSDIEGDELIYSYSEIENIIITFEDGITRITPDENFTGTRFVFITASDSYDAVSSNVLKVDVVDIGIELLDVQKVKNITVSFLTYGTNNLTIKAAGSYAEFFNDDIETADNLEILELKCDDFEIFDRNGLIETSGLWFALQNGSRLKVAELVQESALLESMLVEGYSCQGTSYLTSRVISGENLAQEIKFGNISIIADVFDVIVSNTFEIRGKEDNKLAVFDSFGNLDIKGNLTENAAMANDGNDFMMQDLNGVISLLITNPEGNMAIRGFLNENQSVLVPGLNSFIVQNNLGDVVAYADANGNMFLKGVIEEFDTS